MKSMLYHEAHAVVQECNAEIYGARQKMFAGLAAKLLDAARALHETDGLCGECLTRAVDEVVRGAARTIASEAEGFNLFRNFDWTLRRLYEEMAEKIERDGLESEWAVVSSDDEFRDAYLEYVAKERKAA